MIDLTPEELLQRLKEGKVYIPEQARLAMNRFFTPGNLTALRELALRQAAARVDDQMTSYMRSHAIAGPWPASERILVCIAEDGQAISLVRTAKRSAERRQAQWITLYIQTYRHATMPESVRQNVLQALHLTEALGGEAMTVASEDIAGEILRIARDRNVSVIIIGKSQRSLWSRLMRPSVVSTVLDRGGSFDILITSGRDPRQQRFSRSIPSAMSLPWHKRLSWPSYAGATMAVVIATIIGWGLDRVIGQTSLPLIYLIAILLVVADHGFWVTAYASFLSFCAFDFFFIKPRFSLAIERYEDFITLVFFLVAALAIGLIGDRQRRQMQTTQQNAEHTQSLYAFSKTVAATATLDGIAEAIVRYVAQSLKAKTVLLLPSEDRLESAACFPPETRLDTASGAAMDWAFRHGKPAGFNSDTLPHAAFYGLPLRRGDSTMGVLALCTDDKKSLSSEQEHFLAGIASQSAVAIERARLAANIARTQAG